MALKLSVEFVIFKLAAMQGLLQCPAHGQCFDHQAELQSHLRCPHDFGQRVNESRHFEQNRKAKPEIPGSGLRMRSSPITVYKHA